MTINDQSVKKIKIMTGRRITTIILMAISLFSLIMIFSGPLAAAPIIFAQTATEATTNNNNNNNNRGVSSSSNTAMGNADP